MSHNSTLDARPLLANQLPGSTLKSLLRMLPTSTQQCAHKHPYTPLSAHLQELCCLLSHHAAPQLEDLGLHLSTKLIGLPPA